MDPTVTRRLAIAGSIPVAFFVGWEVAQGSLSLLELGAGLALLWMAGRWLAVEIDALVTGAVIVGYLIGNRGFAQIHAPGLPLFPGELALGLGLALGIWRAARDKTLPVRADFLNASILLWILAASVRLPRDLRNYGIEALRDFAMVYYALFFFLAQAWSGDLTSRRWLERCLTLGMMFTAPAFVAFMLWPGFLFEHVAIGHTPLIFLKMDVVGGFMAAAVIWFVHRYTATHRWYWLAVATLNLGGVVFCNSRAALVALAVCTIWLFVLGAMRSLKVILAIGATSIVLLLAQALISPAPSTTSPLFRIYESLATVADFEGTHLPRSVTLEDKPDNNVFRLVWWKTVIGQTRQEALWFGSGFGFDLSDHFVQTYYPGDDEDFNTRSPHNFAITVFGRMGLAGFILLLGILANIAWKTWRSARHNPDARDMPMWLGVWAIFTSACFGVVLEGPMGAVVFWTILGLANASTATEREPREEENAISATAELAADAPFTSA